MKGKALCLGFMLLALPLPGAERGAVTITTTRTNDDGPSIATDGRGTAAIAWLSWDGTRDTLRLAWVRDGRRTEPQDVPGVRGELDPPRLLFAPGGRLWIFWGENVEGNREIRARSLAGGSWGPIETLSSSPGPDIACRVAAGRNGAIHLVWQSLGAEGFDILLRVFDGRRWGEAVPVAASAAGEWFPAVAADEGGGAWIAWTTYEKGNYDVRLRRYGDGALGPVIPIATTPQAERRPSLASDGRGRLWIAWEECGVNWGKDTKARQADRGARLHDERHVRIACFRDGRLLQPARPFRSALPATAPPEAGGEDFTWPPEYLERPALAVDRAGRPWLFVRAFSGRYQWHSSGGMGPKKRWITLAACYAGDRWTQAVALPRSSGRTDQIAAAAATGDGLAVVHATDHRGTRGASGRNLPNADVVIARLPGPAASSADPVLVPFEPTARGREIALQRPSRNEGRRFRIEDGGRTLCLYWGDLHRHTEISLCPRSPYDGSVCDAYQYAFDAANLDFLAVTDHHVHQSPYMRWYTVKEADRFHRDGTFVTFYAYERSQGSPYGHRNCIAIERVPLIFGSGVEPLWMGLRGRKAVDIPHQLQGPRIDWTHQNPATEPVVELYQGRRQSYEYGGAPNPPAAEAAGRTPADQGGERPRRAGGGRRRTSRAEAKRGGGAKAASGKRGAGGGKARARRRAGAGRVRDGNVGSLWDALGRGLRVGVVASSDHSAVHDSYAAVYAEALTREALLDAIRRRHTYAASDKIFLDFRVDGHLMGEAYARDGKPRITARVEGTGPIERIEIVRNATFLHTARPGGPDCALSFVDEDPPEGNAYYYLRVIQEDGMMAWSSPVWALKSGPPKG